MNQENQNQKLCGVKLKLPITKSQEESIDELARKHNYKFILMPYKEDSFIVVFDNQTDRDEFKKEIDSRSSEQLESKVVNSIKIED